MNKYGISTAIALSGMLASSGAYAFHAMSEVDDLGLDELLGGAATGAEANADTGVTEVAGVDALVDGSAPVAEKATRAKRQEVKIADLQFGTADLVPAQKRGGAKGSKYGFDKLAAPTHNGKTDDGADKWLYSTFTVLPEDAANFDADLLKRSVQSATTQANTAAKDDKSPARFVTRQAIANGVVVGVTVYRVDNTLDTDAEDKEEAAA